MGVDLCEGVQAGVRAVRAREGDGAVEQDDGRRLEFVKIVVEFDEFLPIGFGFTRRRCVNCRYLGLEVDDPRVVPDRCSSGFPCAAAISRCGNFARRGSAAGCEARLCLAVNAGYV